MKKSYTKICPSCKSKDIIFEATDAGVFDVCRRCGFRMHSFPEVEDKKKKPRKTKDGCRIVKICQACGTNFKTFRKRRQIYCSRKCYKIATKNRSTEPLEYFSTEEEIINDIRNHYEFIKQVAPLKAKELADEMESIEGPAFVEKALDGLVPFDKTKKIKIVD